MGAPFIIAILACVIAAAAVPVCRRAAVRLGLVARPADDRWHRAIVPKLGGLAMLLAFASSLILGGWGDTTWLVMVVAVAMCAIGFADDVRAMAPATKLVLQTLSAAAFVYFAPDVSITGMPVLDTVISVFWVVGLTNAFNLLDNIDGLAAGTAAIASTSLIVLLAMHGNAAAQPSIAVAAAIGGAAIGFLFFNFHPASVFMGDAGSHLLGATLAGATLLAAGHFEAGAIPVGAVPIVLLLIPIVDTTFVTLTRGLAGRSAFLGGRDHLSHRLVALGIGERRAVLVLYALAAAGGAVAIGLTQLSATWSISLAVLYVLALVALGVFLGHIESQHPELQPVTPLLSEVAYRRRAFEAAIDLCLVAVAYYFAFNLRFRDEEFLHFLPYFVKSLPVVLGCQMLGLWAVGKYRQVWYTLSADEVFTTLRGIVLGVSLSVLAVLYLYRFEGFSRSVFGFEVLILAALLVGARVAISLIDEYLRHSRSRGRQVIIFGAGKGGRLLVRELLQNPDLGLVPVGFVDDDPAKRRMRIEGLRVLGTSAELPAIARGRGVTEVAIGIRDLTPEQFDRVTTLCDAHGLTVRRMRFSLEDVRRPDDRAVIRFRADRGPRPPRG